MTTYAIATGVSIEKLVADVRKLEAEGWIPSTIPVNFVDHHLGGVVFFKEMFKPAETANILATNSRIVELTSQNATLIGMLADLNSKYVLHLGDDFSQITGKIWHNLKEIDDIEHDAMRKVFPE